MAKSEKLKAEMRANKARRHAARAADLRLLERAAAKAAAVENYSRREAEVLAGLAELQAEEEARMAASRAWRNSLTAQFLEGEDLSREAAFARNARLWGC